MEAHIALLWPNSSDRRVARPNISPWQQKPHDRQSFVVFAKSCICSSWLGMPRLLIALYASVPWDQDKIFSFSALFDIDGSPAQLRSAQLILMAMTAQEFRNYDIKNLNIIGNKTLPHGYLFISIDLINCLGVMNEMDCSSNSINDAPIHQCDRPAILDQDVGRGSSTHYPNQS